MLPTNGTVPRVMISSISLEPSVQNNSKASGSILQKISTLTPLFGNSFAVEGKSYLAVSNNSPKTGLVYALFTQMRRENKGPEGATAYLVRLFDSSELGKNPEKEEVSEHDSALQSDELEEEEPEAEESLDFEEDVLDPDLEEDGLEMAEGGLDEGDSDSSNEEESVETLQETAIQKMLNHSKALILEKWAKDKNTYASVLEALPSLRDMKNTYSVFQLHWSVAADKGSQLEMNESFFSEECDAGYMVGVLGGKILHRPLFAPLLEKLEGDVEQALKEFVSQIDPLQKCQVLLCFIDKRSRFIYSVGYGDSEVCIYRSIDQRYKTIPLSYAGYKGFSVPVSLNQVQIGDTLILASSGCKKILSEEEIQRKIATKREKEDLALSLLNDAIYVKRSLDNATVVALNIMAL